MGKRDFQSCSFSEPLHDLFVFARLEITEIQQHFRRVGNLIADQPSVDDRRRHRSVPRIFFGGIFPGLPELQIAVHQFVDRIVESPGCGRVSAFAVCGKFYDQNAFLRTADIVIVPVVHDHDEVFCLITELDHVSCGLAAGLFVGCEDRADGDGWIRFAETFDDADGIAETVAGAAGVEPAVAVFRFILAFVSRRDHVEVGVEKQTGCFSGNVRSEQDLPSVQFLHGAVQSADREKIPDGFRRAVDCGNIFGRWTQPDQFVQQIQILLHIGSLLMMVEIQH